MEKETGRKRLLTLLIVLTLLVIWGNSLLPGFISGGISEWVMNLLNRGLADIAGTGMTGDSVLRKMAHAAEFAALGVELTVLLRVLLRKEGSLLLLCGVTVALTDETIQLFVSGRAGRVKDVWIDMGGFCLGIFAVWLVRRLRKKFPEAEK